MKGVIVKGVIVARVVLRLLPCESCFVLCVVFCVVFCVMSFDSNLDSKDGFAVGPPSKSVKTSLKSISPVCGFLLHPFALHTTLLQREGGQFLFRLGMSGPSLACQVCCLVSCHPVITTVAADTFGWTP